MGLSGRTHSGTVESGREVFAEAGRGRNIDTQREGSAWNIHERTEGVARKEEPLPPPGPTSAVTPAVFSGMTEPVIPMVPPTPDDKRNESGTGSVRKADRAKVFVVEATEGSTSPAICEAAQDVGPDITRVWFVGV